ncbi:hypothetical protein N7468_007329 [Penicillium chermesinum]|uniref:Transcription factor BYE1 n=1 Tax=Penicillium chermesinum TaxID=63820 RepID=A0A9W9NWU2_9EURO|nr:uncharacterized protein N7468_007329 [Penicillium chermesinum]KAJ5226104.1 hypothetical protein N7468_007329 [Penicillium chermesinum]KAJ6160710.1 hypothetical protein N7470_004106 [Penicillium chermesinum]
MAAQPETPAVHLLTTMPDEPRRSGRATKGQHKNLELPDAPSKKGKGKAKSDKSSKASAEPTPGPSEGDEEEIIRCICGQYEEEEDVERDMICCDSCSAWQHNDCMGLTFAKGHEPDNYYCEQCRPENHKALLDKIAKGEKPWEEVAERRRREAEEKKSKRKKGGKKGGKKSRPSEAKTEVGTPVRGGMSATPGPTTSPAPATSASVEPDKNANSTDSRRSSTNKRKLEESTEAETTHQAKQQRVSSQSPASSRLKSESGALGSVDELQIPARKSAATALVKLFTDQVSAAEKAGSVSLTGQSTEDIATRLGLAIESAIYQNLSGGNGEPTEPYKLQLRTILFNVKKNPSLRDRLLSGSLTPDALSTMKPEDMASKELQQKDAEIKREAERQHIIVQEQGPRMRRTHKGDELIEDETHNATTESIFSGAPRRLTTDLEASPGNQSPITPKVQQGTKQKNDAQPSTGEHHDEVFPEVATNIREPVPHGHVQADADIDQLLRDESESPPYSPKDFTEDDLIWRGKLSMLPVAEFSSSAKFVGGADPSGQHLWTLFMPQILKIDGRIDLKLATEYLCGLRFSQSTDVTITSINYPDTPAQQDGFNRLFDYFATRKRYGVIGSHPFTPIKDTYIVPIEIGTTKMPEFLELMENNALRGPTTQRTFLVVFVSKIIPDQHILNAPPAPAGFNYMRDLGFPSKYPTMEAGSRRKPSPEAFEILGDYVYRPTIQQLIQKMPTIERTELEVVRAVLDGQPSIADDYSLLYPALQEYFKDRPQDLRFFKMIAPV